MRGATNLLRRLQSLGIELRADHDRITFRPRQRVTAEIQAEIVLHKQQILRLLADDPALGKPVALALDGVYLSALGSGGCFVCRGVIFWRLKPNGALVCAICHPPGPPPERIEWRRGRARG